jgi:hypothetical protein
MTSGQREAVVRLVVRDGGDRDELDDALAACGCALVNVVAPSPSHPGQMIYASRDRRGFVHLVDDAVLGATYLTSSGEGAAADLEALRASVAVYGDDDMAPLVAAARDDAGVCRALGVLALTAGRDPGDVRLDAFAGALGHESAGVRTAALVALSYAPWPGLRGHVERLATGDVDPLVRLQAARVLQMLGP